VKPGAESTNVKADLDYFERLYEYANHLKRVWGRTEKWGRGGGRREKEDRRREELVTRREREKPSLPFSSLWFLPSGSFSKGGQEGS
jgi:hypothetical protein